MLNNRFFSFLFISLVTFSLSAQQQRKQTNKQVSTSAQQELRNLRFDPRKPTLSATTISNVLDVNIRKNLLEKKLPEKMEDMNSDNEISDSKVIQLLFSYKVLVRHPDLEEVSRVPLKWFTAYENLLKQFSPIATQINYARIGKSQEKYTVAVGAFKKQQAACLAFLKKKQPKITSEQLMKIRNANIRRRRAEYNARIKKEREEQLKKLQEEKSQKNTNK